MNDNEHDVRIDTMIETSTAGEVPAEVETALKSQLASFRLKIEQTRPGRLVSVAAGFRLALGQHRNGIIGLSGAAVLVAAVVLLVNPGGSGRVYAAAARRLQQAQTLQYTVVLNSVPYVAVDFTHQEPGFQRMKCSWGVEVRADSVAGRQLILLHYARQYLFGTEAEAKQAVQSADAALEQLRSLPDRADQALGAKTEDGKTLEGFRVSDKDGALDIWVDRATGNPDHVDITILRAGKPVHQLHVRGIRAGAQAAIAGMDMQPPAGYSPVPIPGQASTTPAGADAGRVVTAQFRTDPEKVEIVLPMTGSHLQHVEAVGRVEAELKRWGIQPLGPAFGRYYNSAADPLPVWEVGFPVPAGATAQAPFEIRRLEATLVAQAVVAGPWGGDPGPRWSAFLKSVFEQGYAPAGPAQESWLGGTSAGETPRTEMTIPVSRTK